MTAAVIDSTGGQPRNVPVRGNDVAHARIGADDDQRQGLLWQLLGSPTGPVRGKRTFAVGAVVDQHEGRKIRAIETETRDEFAVSRVRRQHEIDADAYPSCVVYRVEPYNNF